MILLAKFTAATGWPVIARRTLRQIYFSGLAILLGAQLNATIDQASRPVRPGL